MIFPIGDDQVKGGYRPVFSYGLIALNVAVFLVEAQMPETRQASFVHLFGSVPAEITQGKSLFTLLTSMFLHGDWLHLLSNMLFLWVFADNIEATVGNLRFFLFYLLGGLIAAGTHIWFNWDSAVPMIGASGAISAVMGAYLVMYPKSRIKLLFLIFPFHISAWAFLGIWIFQQWTYGTAELSEGLGHGVAWWAHIGGFVFGLVAGLFFRITGTMSSVELESEHAYRE